MSKRSFLYSAAFIGLVAATGATISPAQAQKGIALQPATQWAITKVDGSSQQNAYCAAARRYRPNTILTFARNSNDEASFALDFQTPKFRQAEGMTVMLDPGAGQQRAFEVYPVSNQAFVIRLGRDGEFFSAIEKTGFLRVEFDGKAYHFDLADIDLGQEKLATCVANSIVPAAGDEGSPVVADSGDQFQRDVEDLRRQLAKLQGENRKMTGASENYETASSGIMTDQLSRQITQLEQENQDLRSKLKSINAGNIDALRSAKDVQTISRLTEENQQLRAALDTEQAEDIQTEVLYDQIKTLEDENKTLRESSTQADNSGVSEKDLLELLQENERLKEQLAAVAPEADGTELKAAIIRLEEENAALKSAGSDNDTLVQLQALRKENKRLQSVMEASAASGDSSIVVKELKGQVDRLAHDVEVKEHKLVEMSKLATEVQMLKATNEELEKQLIESALRGPVSARTMTHKIAALETQNDSLLQKIQSESDATAAADAESIETLKVENEALKKTIADSQTLVEMNKTLQTEVENLRRENEELKVKAAAAPAGGVDAAELQKLKDDNETLRTQLQQKDNELAALRADVERLSRENEELRNNPPVPTVNSPIPGGAPNPEVEALTRENENLRQQIANSNVAAKDTEIADLKAKLAEQEVKVAAADEALKKAEESTKAANDSAAKAKKEAKAAQKKAEEEAKAAHEAAAQPAPAPSPEEEAIAAKVKTEEGNVEDELIRAAATEGQPQQVPAEVAQAPEVSPIPSHHPQEEAVMATPQEEPQQVPAPQEEITWNEAPAPAPKQGLAISAQPLATPAIEQEMIRLEHELSEAKASGDQMAIQQAARDYMNLKSRMTASQELAASTPSPSRTAPQSKESEALLGYAGTAKAPVADVEQMQVSPPPSPEPVRPAGEASLPEAATGQEGYRASINDSRMVTPESVQESYDRSQEIMNGSTTGAPSGQWAQAQPANVNTASVGGVYQPPVGIPQILDQANVVDPNAVKLVQNASGGDKIAYQWKADKVYGSAIQQPLSDPSRFDGAVQAYLEQTKKRCGQDFAAVADGTSNANGTRIDTYEIACVGQGISSSASLIFFSKQGTFTVLAHEAPAEALENAMDIRDRLVKTIKGS